MSEKRNAKTIVAGLVICASVLLLYAFLHGFGPSFDTASHKALGETLANEALKLRGPAGRITIIARDTSLNKNPCVDAQLKAFQETIKKARTTNSVLFIKLNPIRLVAVPPGDFLELIKKRTETDVIVSLIGPPDLSDQQASQVRAKSPKIIAVCSGWGPRQVDLRRIFEQGLLTSAVISREDSSKLAAATSRETFERNFAVVTPGNLSDLPLVVRSAAR